MKIFISLFVVLFGAISLSACTPKDEVKPAQYDLYLLIGQSNMAGRAPIDNIGTEVPNKRIMMLSKDGKWVPARDPLHFDKPGAGVGPGLAFAKVMAAQNEDNIIGLIPAAAGGSPISSWVKGGYHDQTDSQPYDDAVARTRLAMKNGNLKGILWHQGESDAHAGKAELYQNALLNLVTDLRRDLNAPDVPFIVGGLGDFKVQNQPKAGLINAVLQNTPNLIPHTGYVSSKGLTHMGDGTHFSANASQELGRRYAQKYIHMQDIYEDLQLVWADEFNTGTMPDPEKWNYRTGDGCPRLCGFGNNEWQWYTDEMHKNARIEDGKLIIEAHKEAVGTKEYSSARLNSRYKGDWLYGRFEIRAKMPSGRGTWPAIWMMPSDMEYGKWPKSGEIDIMEHVGYKPDEVSGTVHTESFNHIIQTQKGVHHPFLGSEDNFHTYGINWTAEKIEFFVDDEMYFIFENTGEGAADYPFNKRFYMILNLAIGGNLGGKEGVDPDAFPTQMEIDYVRVYQVRI